MIPESKGAQTTEVRDYEKLIDFNDDDYLLLVGDPAAIGLCCAVAAAINGRFTVLKWDRQEMTYYPVSFDIRGGSQDLGELHV